MGWSCAAATCEPRQVGNEATVSGARWVPQGYRAGASWRRVADGGGSKVGARPSSLSSPRAGRLAGVPPACLSHLGLLVGDEGRTKDRGRTKDGRRRTKT